MSLSEQCPLPGNIKRVCRKLLTEAIQKHERQEAQIYALLGLSEGRTEEEAVHILYERFLQERAGRMLQPFFLQKLSEWPGAFQETFGRDLAMAIKKVADRSDEPEQGIRGRGRSYTRTRPGPRQRADDDDDKDQKKPRGR